MATNGIRIIRLDVNNERLSPLHLLPCTVYHFVSARDPAGNEDKKAMKLKALLIGPGSGLVLYAVLYAING